MNRPLVQHVGIEFGDVRPQQLLCIVSVGIVNIMNVCLDERVSIESGVSDPQQLLFVFS